MKKTVVFFLMVIGFAGFGQEEHSKKVAHDLVWGAYYYTNGAFSQAIAQWEKIPKPLPPKTQILLAKAYAKCGKKEQAEHYLSGLIDSRHVAVEDYYFYASLLPDKPKLAAEYRLKAARLPLDKRVVEEGTTPLENFLINLDRNTPMSEFGGYFVPQNKGLAFYFLSPQAEDWTKRMQRRMISSTEVYNLHRAKLNTALELENEVQLPTNINSIFQEGPIAIDTIQKIIFISRSSGKVDLNNKVQVDLYRYDYAKPNPIPVPLKINREAFSTLHPAVDYGNNRLLFASDRPGGQGGMDLYYIPLDQIDQNPEVINLGPDINTDNNETFPFVLADGTLFYTNEAQSNEGDFEINMALKGPENRWKTYLLPPPYNSNKDDFSFSLLLKEGLGTLSSNRAEGKGNDDLYIFRFKPPMSALEDTYAFKPKDTLVIPFEGVLQNDLDLMVAQDPLVLLVDKKALLKESPQNGKVKLNANGSFLYKSTSSRAVVDSFSYLVQSPYSVSKEAWVYLKPKEEPLTEEILETFRPIFYDLDRNNLKEDYRSRVDAVVRVMNQYPQMEIEIISSTDCLGSEAYNLKLSQERTNTILTYVKTRISNPERLQGKGIGESNIPNNDTKNYSLLAGQFSVYSNAVRQQKALEDRGIESEIRTLSKGLHAVVLQDFDYMVEAQKAKAAFVQQGISSSLEACECYQLPEAEHQQQRKTIFNIIAKGEKNETN